VAADEERWKDAGLYDPNDPAGAERLSLLRYLTERGATMDEMLEAHRNRALPGVAGDLVIRTRTPTLGVHELAERSDVPVSRVLRVLLAAGIPAQADAEVPAELMRLMDAFQQAAALMGDEAILAFTRVMGAAAANIAEAAVALFFAEMGPATVREGADELGRALLTEAATAAFTEVPDVLTGLVISAFVRATQRSQLARSSTTPGFHDGEADMEGQSEIVALGFVDLVGSTAWAQSTNLREQSLALTRFESAAWTSAVLEGGRVVKTIGDEVFFVAPTTEAACRIATEVCEAAEADAVLPPARGAVGVGPAIPRDGDYFGPLVNLLSRMVESAAPGELIVTEPAVAELSPDRWSRRPLEPVQLRGIAGPVQTFHVKQRASSS
jgi:adenylate cyclase